jgi:hypothetical protein
MAEESLTDTTSSTNCQTQHDVVPLPFDEDPNTDDHTSWQSHDLLTASEGRSKEMQVSRTVCVSLLEFAQLT